jgi:hypothetical protein
MVSGSEALAPAREQKSLGLGESFRLESIESTVVYWATALLFSLAFWVTPFPPLIDYPQHVAVASILRRMADPSSPERALYDPNFITYNGGFHMVLAALSFVMRPEIAGKCLLSVYPLAFAYAVLSLVRAAGRPRWYAFFALPITFSFAVGWGFANYFMSVPFVILAFAWWLRSNKGDKGALYKVMAISALLSYTHVLATLCLCLTIGVAGLRSFHELGATWRVRLFGLAKLPLAVWPAIVWSLFAFVHNRNSPHANWEGWDEGRDDPLWYKLLHVTAYAVGNFGDHSDQLLLTLSLGMLIILWQWPREKTRAEPVMKTLAVTWAALYCVVPKVFIATWFVFERFPTFAVVFAAAAAPIAGSSFAHERWIRKGAAAVALLAGMNTVGHFRVIPDEADADAILDEIPEGKRVIAVTWSNTGQPVVLREMWVHLLAYYQARRPGQIAYSFAKFESMPVHYAVGKVPPPIPGGMEWDGDKYDPGAPYARYWDTVLVRTPDDEPDADPRVRTFRSAASGVRVLARHGRFWLYDASMLRALPVRGGVAGSSGGVGSGADASDGLP